MRTVRQLAQDMRPTYPDAATVAESKLYMDDLVYSIADEPSAVRLSRELISLFKAGDFDLVKWTSNSQVVLESLPDSHRNSVDFSVDSNNVSKVLGLSWEPADDSFFFTTSDVKEKCTKRNILSIVARLFDVLGLVAPTILYAKLLIKELWLSNIGWDDVPPENVIQRFSALIQEFPLITTLRIPRHVGVVQNSTVLVVGFCDASMNGYGTVIYLHTTDPTGNITVRLLCAKSKVSPTKVTTLARLELCAAVMMSKLIWTIHENFRERIPIAGTYAFSDSTIALSWIYSSPHRWSVFVSNRVAQCQENLPPENFYHVSGNENPSDCLEVCYLHSFCPMRCGGTARLGFAPQLQNGL
ncbi:pao retrotransposon peptidase domain-containing protein [Phthorimaea operculella]|nr:pao retrotransposon peptidase domain-containing protein [Phthorimaea operculella]